MKKISAIIATSFLILVSSFSLYGAQSIVELSPTYQFQLGDNVLWADPDFDDSSWQTVAIYQFPDNILPTIGWLRINFQVDSTNWNKPVALSINLIGAADIYMDGKLIQQIGKTGTSIDNELAVILQLPRIIPVTFFTWITVHRKVRSPVGDPVFEFFSE